MKTDVKQTFLHPGLDEVTQLILDRIRSDLPLTQDITDHLFAKRGKRIRAQMVLWINDAHEQPHPQATQLAAIIELIHASTLLHDDVIDGSSLRRGIPTANNTFGNQAAILVGDYLYSMAFRLISELGHPPILNYLATITSQIVEGEIMQLAHSHSHISWDRYLRIITAKTGLLFAASCHCTALLHQDRSENLLNAGLDLGIGYQIIDDCLDYTLGNAAWGKKPGDDLREGKTTLPLILLSRQYPEWDLAQELQNPSQEFVEKALHLVHEHDILSQCRETANEYIHRAQAQFEKLKDPSELLALCAWLKGRNN